MQRRLVIMMDPEKSKRVMIGSDGKGTPWEDLAILLEAVGAVAAIVRKEGYTHHKDQPLNEYAHGYLDHVLNDYTNAFKLNNHPGGKDDGPGAA